MIEGNIENKKILKVGYEDTDKKIEINIYGIIFEIRNLNENKIKEYENMDKENKVTIESELENIIGKGAIEKINRKRNEDGYENLTIDAELNILGMIFQAYYTTVISNFTNKLVEGSNMVKEQVKEVENMFIGNRENRRNYKFNRNYRRNRRRY